MGVNRESSSFVRYSVAPEVSLIVGKVLDDRGQGMDDQILDGIDCSNYPGTRRRAA